MNPRSRSRCQIRPATVGSSRSRTLPNASLAIRQGPGLDPAVSRAAFVAGPAGGDFWTMTRVLVYVVGSRSPRTEAMPVRPRTAA
jgi:hypothetical protein